MLEVDGTIFQIVTELINNTYVCGKYKNSYYGLRYYEEINLESKYLETDRRGERSYSMLMDNSDVSRKKGRFEFYGLIFWLASILLVLLFDCCICFAITSQGKTRSSTEIAKMFAIAIKTLELLIRRMT